MHNLAPVRSSLLSRSGHGRRALLRALIVASALAPAACLDADDGAVAGDDVADVELVEDGKGDAWAALTPRGTYRAEAAAGGEISTLTLAADRTFRRETARAGGAPRVSQGRYKFTTGGGNHYLRLLDASGALLVRYGYEQQGRELRLRVVGTGRWQALLADDGRDQPAPGSAGVYLLPGDADQVDTDGAILDLVLHPSQRFYLRARGALACASPGHLCPSASAGRAAQTEVIGRWDDLGGGARLHPIDPSTGEEGAAIRISLVRQGGRVHVAGTADGQALRGDLATAAVFTDGHEVTDDDLAGTWVVAPTDAAEAPSLWGGTLGAGDAPHRVTFDPVTSELCELPPRAGASPRCGVFQVIAHRVEAEGVIYAYRGDTLVTALKITRASANQLTLRLGLGYDGVGGRVDAAFTLRRE
ncbi:MAG: hypothetical protein KA297_10140 [Kofleriaceae bacterium]|nr:hypothetical protein [Kofleriaceae bacterium]